MGLKRTVTDDEKNQCGKNNQIFPYNSMTNGLELPSYIDFPWPLQRHRGAQFLSSSANRSLLLDIDLPSIECHECKTKDIEPPRSTDFLQPFLQCHRSYKSEFDKNYVTSDSRMSPIRFRWAGLDSVIFKFKVTVNIKMPSKITKCQKWQQISKMSKARAKNRLWMKRFDDVFSLAKKLR